MKISPEIMLESHKLNSIMPNISEDRIDKTKIKLNLNIDNSNKENIET